tara:strand:+ start:2796 stop:3725 length:930 start_codon:yes stop_codon:yes gene_type:complete
MVQSYNILSVNSYKKVYNNNIVKVFEPKNIIKKDTNSLVFFTGANSVIPADIYSNFINTLNQYNFSVSVVPNDIICCQEFLNSIENDYKEIIPISHSSGYTNLIKTIYNISNIDKSVLLDPVDNSKLVDKQIFNIFNDLTPNLNYLNNLLILNAEKSYKGSIFPKFELPFIPLLALNTKKLKKNNPNLNIETFIASDYGHSDVLDTLWSDLMHSTISKGTEIREQENLDIYLKWLATKIYKFINEDINYDEPNSNIEFVELNSVKNNNDNDNDNDNDNEVTIEIINNKELIEYNNNKDTINYDNIEYLN